MEPSWQDPERPVSPISVRWTSSDFRSSTTPKERRKSSEGYLRPSMQSWDYIPNPATAHDVSSQSFPRYKWLVYFHPYHLQSGADFPLNRSMAASESRSWIWVWTYIQHLNLRFPRSMPQLLQAFRGPKGIYIYITMITSTYYRCLTLQKYTLLNEGLVPCNGKRLQWWTVWIGVKIKPFCQVVDEHPLLISAKADISPVTNIL